MDVIIHICLSRDFIKKNITTKRIITISKGDYGMSPKLMAHEYVPSGFEIVINNKEICPESSGGIWKLWWNVKLTDDPEAWDKDKSINKMQDQLVKLSLDHRLIRTQMAEFC